MRTGVPGATVHLALTTRTLVVVIGSPDVAAEREP
jgi:hypothetical protein